MDSCRLIDFSVFRAIVFFYYHVRWLHVPKGYITHTHAVAGKVKVAVAGHRQGYIIVQNTLCYPPNIYVYRTPFVTEQSVNINVGSNSYHSATAAFAPFPSIPSLIIPIEYYRVICRCMLSGLSIQIQRA